MTQRDDDKSVRLNVAQSLEDMARYGFYTQHKDRQNVLFKAVELLRADPSHADAPSDGIAQCLRQTVSASSATGETISALRLAKAWLEEDEGRRLEDVIRIDNECRGHNGKGAFNERYVEMCRAVVNACGGTSDGRCADKP